MEIHRKTLRCMEPEKPGNALTWVFLLVESQVRHKATARDVFYSLIFWRWLMYLCQGPVNTTQRVLAEDTSL
jgi:hypothetical protein